MEMGISGNSGNVVRDGRIHMTGDVETGQAFQRALSQLDLDWEEVLARYIGDSPARKTGVVMRELGLWAQQSVDLTSLPAISQISLPRSPGCSQRGRRWSGLNETWQRCAAMLTGWAGGWTN